MNILKYINFSALFIFASCIDSVTTDFDFKEDLIIINAIATNVPGATNITVEKTFIEFGGVSEFKGLHETVTHERRFSS